MKPLLPLRLLGLPVANPRAAEPDGQLPSAPHGKSLQLIWQDEFDGDTLDESKWTYRPDGKRKGGWWSRKAIRLDGDGHLVISTFMDGNKPFALAERWAWALSQSTMAPNCTSMVSLFSIEC